MPAARPLRHPQGLAADRTGCLDDTAIEDGQNANDRFLYASTPSAGLHLLLQMWPQVRAALPDATLHVYYGFWPYAMWAEQPHLVSLKKTLEPMLKQPGVYYHGMVSERDLAKGYASAGGNLSLTAGSFTECSHLSSPPKPPPPPPPPPSPTPPPPP